MAAAHKFISQFCRSTHSFQRLQRLPTATAVRCSSFLSSRKVAPREEYPEIEIIHNAPEWKYVERLLPQKTVPKPIQKAVYPSGWKPQIASANPDLKYFVARTKNHMVPVYLQTSFRGQRRITVIRRIQGDIWELERELRVVVEKARDGKLCASRVNEMSGQIHFHGDYVDVVREYLKEKGF
ncbi:PREDICTED: probable 39S ribosomal protein L49, mitochondrial [Rhagoletis zephyria]|uniref:probable 39S ribosomal protein L49, mitochondrial n=1 Tax=Rhagoletis zephyria TaxID=28612 RepID=UPI000811708B|nr:PREDICTED: probable 39S ribosomal protein L49, mitochondrial [Rhagoletis zephyria]